MFEIFDSFSISIFDFFHCFNPLISYIFSDIEEDPTSYSQENAVLDFLLSIFVNLNKNYVDFIFIFVGYYFNIL